MEWGAEYINKSKDAPEAAGGCVYFSLPDLLSVAAGQALGDPEVSGIRHAWILISKNQSELKGQFPDCSGTTFPVSQMSQIETVTSQSWALTWLLGHSVPEIHACWPPLVFLGTGGVVFIAGVF